MEKFTLITIAGQETLGAALGISEERWAKLNDILGHHGPQSDEKSVDETLKNLVAEANTFEEAIVLAYGFGLHFGEEQASDFAQMMASLGAGIPGDDEDGGSLED